MRPRPGSRDSGTGTVPDPFSAAQLEYEAGPGRTQRKHSPGNPGQFIPKKSWAGNIERR